MADNLTTQTTPATVPSGTVIATDDVAGTHYQYVKLVDGTADSSAKIGGDATNGLDVDVTRIAAGASVDVGATTDAEASGNGSLIAIVKRLRTLLGSVITLLGGGLPAALSAAGALKVDLSTTLHHDTDSIATQARTWTETLLSASAYRSTSLLQTAISNAPDGLRNVWILVDNTLDQAVTVYLVYNGLTLFNGTSVSSGVSRWIAPYGTISGAVAAVWGQLQGPFCPSVFGGSTQGLYAVYQASVAPTSGSLTIRIAGALA